MRTEPVEYEWTEPVLDDEGNPTFNDDGEEIKVERRVHLLVGGDPSTLKMGMERSILIESEQTQFERGGNGAAPSVERFAEFLLRTVMYPGMVASVIEQEGFEKWPITYDEFSGIPEELGMRWEAATFGLNPHWKPDLEQINVEEARKKATRSSSE